MKEIKIFIFFIYWKLFFWVILNSFDVMILKNKKNILMHF